MLILKLKKFVLSWNYERKEINLMSQYCISQYCTDLVDVVAMTGRHLEA